MALIFQRLDSIRQTTPVRVGLSALSEGTEEFLQALAQPIVQRLTYDPDAQFDLGDAFYQGFVGGTLGGLTQGADIIHESDDPDGFLSGFLAEEIENGLISIPAQSTQNLEVEFEQTNFDSSSDTISELEDLNRAFQDILDSREPPNPFDPEHAKTSLAKVLDSSRGLADNINVLNYYLSNTDYVLNSNLPGPVGYRPTDDTIYYNPQYSLPVGTTMSQVLIHELAHRADHRIYHTAENPNWKSAIEQVRQLATPRSREIENWFQPGGKYENDPFFCGMISAIFKDTIDLPYSQGRKYWKTSGMQETELFANLCTMDILQSPGVQELTSLLAPIYSVWLEIMKGDIT